MNESLRELCLVGFGNPLLDMEVHVDEQFLAKWNLKTDDAILCDQSREQIFEDVVNNYKIQYVAGGSTQNSLRVAQWMCQKPNVAVYFGCVGKDQFARVLQAKADQVGLKTFYQVHSTEPTGTCVVCLTGTCRSMCTRLAAAIKFDVSHINLPDQQKTIETAQFIYTAGFFISSSMETIYHLAEHCCRLNKFFMMNLSAPFIASSKEFAELMPYVDILFGNEEEAYAYAKANGFEAVCLPDIVEYMAALPKKNANRGRMVIITQGADPVYVAKDGDLLKFDVAKVEKEKIVDTNGAGDGFVGGFLSQFIYGKQLDECVDAAIWASNLVIQRSGCSLPEECEYNTI